MRCFFILLLVFVGATAYTQPANSSAPLVLTHITEENGLSDNHVTCVYKDIEELLWVGTADGLNLLDGSTIRVFKNIPADSNSICDNHINAIIEDRSGKIWMATANGFCSYDKHSKKFIAINYYGQGKTPIGRICNIAIDNTNALWLGTDNGLLQYDVGSKKFSRYFNNNTGYGTDTRAANRINHVMISSGNKLWLATTDGLWYFSFVDKTFTKIIHKQNDAYYHPLCNIVYEDSEKNIWAGFWNTGLKKYEPGSGKMTDYGAGLKHGYTIGAINEVEQSNGRKILWLNGQLLAFDKSSGSYFNFQQPVNEKDFPNVNPVLRSADGWVWLAGNDGLYIYDPLRQAFDHDLFDHEITSQQVVFTEYKNGFLAGAQGSDFLKWKDQQGNTVKDFSYLGKKTTAVLCLVPEGPDEFWIGTTDGILHINLVTGYKKWYQHAGTDSSTIPRDFITSLFIDSKKNLWVFPWREGIWQLDRSTGTCKKMIDGFIIESGKTKKLVISDAAEDADGNIWMADLDEGIILYNAATKNFSKPFEKEIGAKTHTSRIFIKTGMAYSALNNAIIKWDIHTRQLQQFQPPAELSKPINDIYPDKNGNWWLATASGLIVFNEVEKTFRKLTTTDGLYRDDVNGTLFCAGDNTMIIGAPTYFSFFGAHQFITNSAKKNLRITAFLANDREIEFNGNKTISLNHSENNIVIRWALPAYGDPLKNQYYCQLQGIDSGWKYIGNKGEIQYANLSTGHYSILLKAITSGEAGPGDIASLDFNIDPPFWKTTWFILLSILVIGGIFILIVRYIAQRNLKEKLLRLEREQAIEKERNRISRDMHDDLGSGLTKIAIMSEVVKKQFNEPEKAKQQLENISASSRELIDNLQDIIWVLNPKNDTLESLAAYIREYALKFFDPVGIEVFFHYPENFSSLTLSEETRRNIFLVVKETFNNTVKHASCNKVEIIIQQKVSQIILVIADDGAGFNIHEVRQFANGLINMKTRIEQVEGNYEIESVPQKGTRTTITIPLAG